MNALRAIPADLSIYYTYPKKTVVNDIYGCCVMPALRAGSRCSDCSIENDVKTMLLCMHKSLSLSVIAPDLSSDASGSLLI